MGNQDDLDLIDCRKAIRDGVCRADCCNVIIISEEIWERNKDKIPKIETLLTKFGVIFPTQLRCPFVDKNLNCLIYDDRPEVCRLYGTTEKLPCPHFFPNGGKRSRQSRRAIIRDNVKATNRLLGIEGKGVRL